MVYLRQNYYCFIPTHSILYILKIDNKRGLLSEHKLFKPIYFATNVVHKIYYC